MHIRHTECSIINHLFVNYKFGYADQLIPTFTLPTVPLSEPLFLPPCPTLPPLAPPKYEYKFDYSNFL